MTERLLGVAGRTALITGGGAGIGRATAELFHEAGLRVAVAEIDPGRAEAMRDVLGPDGLAVVADVRRADDVARAMDEVARRFGRLDVLVNNVGDYLGYKKPFAETTEAEWDELYHVNLRHMFLVTRAALPLMRRDDAGGTGSIVNLSTIESFRGIPLTVVYAAFKAAVTGFTQSLAVELGAARIRVNAVAPETTNSAQIVATTRVPPENRAHLGQWFPIGRFGEGADSAGAALYLASDRLSGWVTGTTIHVDGGALAAGAWMRMPDGERWTHLPVIARDGYDRA